MTRLRWILLTATTALVAALAWAMGWFRRPSRDDWDLAGKVVIVTGANSGIGKETAAGLAACGAHVVMACRSVDKGEAAATEIRERGVRGTLEVLPLDLASQQSIRDFVDAFRDGHDRLDVLVNNAGLVLSERVTTEDGIEATFGINHLGPFLLTNLLLDDLKASAPARVVNVASAAHRQGRLDLDDLEYERRAYLSLKVYATSKLANVLFTRELARRLEGSGVTANCVHPGTINSGFGAEGDTKGLFRILITIARPFFMTPEQGADTSVYLAASPNVADRNGLYWYRRHHYAPSRQARDDDLARQLWKRSAEMVGLDQV